MVRLYPFYIKAEDAYCRQADRLLARCSTTVTPNDHALSPHTGPGLKPRSSLPRRLVDVALLFTCAAGSPPTWHCYHWRCKHSSGLM
jgi:hypothetical protein